MQSGVFRLTTVALALTFLGSAAESRAFADFIFADFGFGSGTPFGGATTLGGVRVVVATTNTETFPTLRLFRDLAVNTDPATVSFTFSSLISGFALDIDRVNAPDEFLTGFNIGLPNILTGDLINVGGRITTSRNDDLGSGRLLWTGISTNVVSFTIGNDPASQLFPAINVVGFGINTVPEPASMIMTGSGLIAVLGYVKVKRRRRPA
jgi:hypothetical protein